MDPNPKSKIQSLPSNRVKGPKSRKIVVLGAGPAGLYCALLLKKADPSRHVTVIERNPAGVTYGWGVVFSDRTLASFQRADWKTYSQITDDFVIWDHIDVRYRGETISCGGHVIAAISRKSLLDILARRCEELGVTIHFNSEVNDLSELPEHDLLIAADGINSAVRTAFEEQFKPRIELGAAKYIWLGADKALNAFNFIFHENAHGLFTTHAYPFSGTTSTFIVECAEEIWLRAGLDRADEAASLAYCQELLEDDLGGAKLLSNNAKWINFPTLTTRHWKSEIRNQKSETSFVVLLGDAAHTAHFSIGAGTKLAMEDAIALAGALEQYPEVEKALNEYELERKPVVETFQRAATESRTYFETIKRYLGLEPMQFAFQLLTRSGRISYDDLHFRDARFGDGIDRWFYEKSEIRNQRLEYEKSDDEKSEVRNQKSEISASVSYRVFAPPPMFAPLTIRALTLPNRVVTLLPSVPAQNGVPYSALRTPHSSLQGVGLLLTEVCAVSSEGRITLECAGMYDAAHAEAWARIVETAHAQSSAKVGVQLGHAGRRGSTRPRSEGLDRPLREGNWPLLSASAIPYTPGSQTPKEMDRADMERVRDEFVRAAKLAHGAGFDWLQLHFGHGYLLASFLSPLANKREDEWGGDLSGRMRYPLEVFRAVRAAWPEERPLSVAFSATDYVRDGFCVEDAVVFAGLLKEAGCDLIHVLAGQTTPAGEPPYKRGFLTPLSDRVRNEAGIPTMVGGYLTTSNEVNTILAAGRADLCVM